MLDLHQNAGQLPAALVAGGEDLVRVQGQHRLIGGDVLGQIGGALIRRSLPIALEAVIPVVQNALASQVVADHAGGYGLPDMGPAAVLPGLDLGEGGALRPEGLHRQFPVVALGPGQGGHHPGHRLRGDLHPQIGLVRAGGR